MRAGDLGRKVVRLAVVATLTIAEASCVEPKQGGACTAECGADASSGLDADAVAREASALPVSDGAALPESSPPVEASGGQPDAPATPDAGSDAGDGGVPLDQTSCSTSGAACTCNAPDPSNPGAANSVTCDPTVGLGAVCCASAGWPSAGSTCSCLTASCSHPAGGGCDCSLGMGGESCNDGAVCCVGSMGDCLCTWGVSTCWTGYRQVAQCDGVAIGCGSESQVASCSIAR